MFKTIKKARLSDEIVKQIKESLFAGKLQAGEKYACRWFLSTLNEERFSMKRSGARGRYNRMM